MGFGFNLALIFLVIPIVFVVSTIWLITRKKIFGYIVGSIFIAILILLFFSFTFQWLFAKKELKKEDYYGTYIINRMYFPGQQADWQYNSFRFEIKDNDSIFFYITDKEKTLKTYKGYITTVKPYKSERIIINMEQPTHHLLISNPTIYRSSTGFYMVFHSPNFKNVFFKKGTWKPIFTSK